MSQNDRTSGLVGQVAIKAPCRVATTANITLSGVQTIDGVAVIAADRVLVKDQTTASQNGIYDADTGAWERSRDFDGTHDVVDGTIVFVRQGSNSFSIYKLTCSPSPPVIGTTSLTFTLSGLSDSANVNFLQAGTGAVIRTVQSKERDVISVEDFGAVGDGATDDKAALALANTASANRSLRFTKSYLVASNLNFSSNVGLIFENGAKLSPNVGVTITIDGPVQSPSGAKIFIGAGTVTTTFAPIAPGINNWFSGPYAGIANVPGPASVGTDNTAFGAAALKTNVSGNGHTAVGSNALKNQNGGFYNVAVGLNALTAAIDAVESIAVGMNSQANSTSGDFNVSAGTNSLNLLTTGQANTALGHNAGYSGQTEAGTVAVGSNALYTNTGDYNVAVGADALRLNSSAVGNVAVGSFVLDANTTGAQNTAVGNSALSTNIIGNRNVAIGGQALILATGNENTACGEQSLAACSSGTNNTAVGWAALNALTTGSNNTGIGSGAAASAVGVSNEMTLGNASVTVVRTAGGIAPGNDAGAFQTGRLFAGVGVPNNANGSDGDFFFRTDGTVAGNTVAYHKQAGAWVAFTTT